MSDASDKLDRNRQAIMEYVARRQRRHDPREEPAGRGFAGGPPDGLDGDFPDQEPLDEGSNWFEHVRHGVKTWWRYHPAHMVVDLASPLLQEYARRKPMQFLGISLAAGAAITFARPWKLISVTTIVVALLKSSQLSHLFTAAMSAADYRKDQNRPE